jgi:hypothetical protein
MAIKNADDSTILPYWIRFWFKYRLAFLGLLLAICVNLLANAIWWGLGELDLSNAAFAKIGGLIALLLATGVLVERVTNAAQKLWIAHNRLKQSMDPPKCPRLIVFLSLALEAKCKPDLTPTGCDLQPGPDADFGRDFDALKKAKQEGGAFWPWEQTLRAVHHHRDSLQELYLICSPETLGQAAKFAAIVRRYQPFGKLPIYVAGAVNDRFELREVSQLEHFSGIDSNHFNRVARTLRALIEKLKREHPHEDIIADFTGGQKPSSAAVIAEAMTQEIYAQYVDTNSAKVFGYQVVLEKAAEPLSV